MFPSLSFFCNPLYLREAFILSAKRLISPKNEIFVLLDAGLSNSSSVFTASNIYTLFNKSLSETNSRL